MTGEDISRINDDNVPLSRFRQVPSVTSHEMQTSSTMPSRTGSDGTRRTSSQAQSQASAGIGAHDVPSAALPPLPPTNPRNSGSRRNVPWLKRFLGRTKFGRNQGSGRSRENESPQAAEDPQTQDDAGDDGSQGRSEGQDSSSELSRKSREGEIHRYYEPVDGQAEEDKVLYRCVLCKKTVGQKNATRFSKHAIEECTKIETPVKERLSQRTKSKIIGPPKSRSEVALALERAKRPRQQQPQTESDAQESCANLSTDDNEPSKHSSGGSDSRHSKRRKTGKKYDRAPDCTPEYVNKVRVAAVEYLIASADSFRNFDKQGGSDSPLLRFLRVIYPQLVGKHLPGSKVLAGRYLNAYYDQLRTQVDSNVMEALKGNYGTIIFDGWDDVNSAPVVNVLLKMEPAAHSGTNVFFLKTVYTGSKSTGAKEYVQIVEDVMSEYGGLSRVCAVTSDSTACCVNARDELTRKYSGIVGVNDQSHVADLLIEDVGKLAWVYDCLDKVATIAKELHNHRKLKERYKSLMAEFNQDLKKEPEFREQVRPTVSGLDTDRETGNFSSDRDPATVFAAIGDFRIRTAVMLVQTSNTRFASAEGVLDAFLRSIYVLRTLVSEEDFFRLYKPRNNTHKQQIKETFIGPIEDEDFENSTREVHMIFRLLRRYLRLFDSNDARISEVYPFTTELGRQLEALPLSSVLTPSRKAQLLRVFKLRKEGPINQKIKVRLLEDIHYTAFLLDPNQAPDDPRGLD